MNIIKGQNCALSSHSLLLQIDWRLTESNSTEIDPSLFLLNADEVVTADADFIFYNQPSSDKGRVQYITAGAAPLYDGKAGFLIDLDTLPSTIANVAIVVACSNPLDFNSPLAAFEWAALDIYNSAGQHLAQYAFNDDVQHETAIVIGMIYRHGAIWKFRAVSQGFVGGLTALATHFGVNVQTPSDAAGITKQPTATVAPSAALANQAQLIKERLERFLADIARAGEAKENETKTRMILDRIFQEVLGYRMENIKPEQSIQGRRADYVLCVDGEDTLVVEAKRAGLPLRERQVFQATAYGAYSGIRWALLTNLETWQLYHISTGERVEADLVFTVHLNNGMSMDAAHSLALISHDGFRQKQALENLHRKMGILSYENLAEALLHHEVISRVRAILSHKAGQPLTQEEVQAAIEQNVLRI